LAVGCAKVRESLASIAVINIADRQEVVVLEVLAVNIVDVVADCLDVGEAVSAKINVPCLEFLHHFGVRAERLRIEVSASLLLVVATAELINSGASRHELFDLVPLFAHLVDKRNTLAVAELLFAIASADLRAVHAERVVVECGDLGSILEVLDVSVADLVTDEVAIRITAVSESRAEVGDPAFDVLLVADHLGLTPLTSLFEAGLAELAELCAGFGDVRDSIIVAQVSSDLADSISLLVTDHIKVDSLIILESISLSADFALHGDLLARGASDTRALVRIRIAEVIGDDLVELWRVGVATVVVTVVAIVVSAVVSTALFLLGAPLLGVLDVEGLQVLDVLGAHQLHTRDAVEARAGNRLANLRRLVADDGVLNVRRLEVILALVRADLLEAGPHEAINRLAVSVILGLCAEVLREELVVGDGSTVVVVAAIGRAAVGGVAGGIGVGVGAGAAAGVGAGAAAGLVAGGVAVTIGVATSSVGAVGVATSGGGLIISQMTAMRKVTLVGGLRNVLEPARASSAAVG
jgi:hypothetical protein